MSTEKEKVADPKLIGCVWPGQKSTAVKYDLFVCLFVFSLFRDTLCHSFDPVKTKMWLIVKMSSVICVKPKRRVHV